MVPGGVVVLGLLAWLAFGPEQELLAALTRDYSWVVYLAGLFLAWRFGRSRAAAALLLVVLVDRGIPYLAASHVPLATGSAAYLVPLVLALLALLEDGTVFSPRGGFQVGAVLGLALILLTTLLFRPDGVEAFLNLGVLPRRITAWTGFSPVIVVAYLGAAVVVSFSALRRRGPLEKAFFWTLVASAPGLQLGPETPAGSAWLMAAGLVLTLSVVEASYAMAFRDELTGLPSRRALQQTLDELGRTYALAMVDVDHFKKFNDKHGHDVGDQVLTMVARCLEAVGGGGKAFRYGGEEFAVAFAGKTLDEARPLAEALRKEIQKSTFVLRDKDRPQDDEEGEKRRGSGGGDQELSVTVSVGLAAPTERGADAREVLEAADQALYRAKKKGRNRVEA